MSAVSDRGRLSIERYSSAAQFLAEAGPWLAAREPENNLVFGLAQLLATGDHPFEEPVLLACVKEDGRVAGCAVRPPPDHLDVTALPPGAAALLAEQAAEYCPGLTSVGGPPAAAREFARTWVERQGGYWRMVHHWSWFVLRAVRGNAAHRDIAGLSEHRLRAHARNRRHRIHALIPVPVWCSRFAAARAHSAQRNARSLQTSRNLAPLLAFRLGHSFCTSRPEGVFFPVARGFGGCDRTRFELCGLFVWRRAV